METNTATQLVASNVRRIRDLRGMKAAHLAQVLGWSKQTLSKLETGARNITVDDLLALAMALQVAPAVLLVPWDADAQLQASIRKTQMHFDSAEAFGWIIGAPTPETLLLMANPVDYFDTTPTPVQRRYGRHWMRQVREELGWNVSDDGTVIETPSGLTVRRTAEED